MLALIDVGVEDMEETDDGIEVYVSPEKLSSTKDTLEKRGFEVSSFELTRKPKSLIKMVDVSIANRVLKLLDDLEEHEDIQKVYANLDIPDDMLNKLK